MCFCSLLAACTSVAAALLCSGVAFSGDSFEWPELPYEPCYRVERIIHPLDVCPQGGSFIFGRSINAQGTIVGAARCTSVGQDRAFIWRMNQPFQWIPTPPDTSSSWAWAINDDGWVAGQLSGGSASGNGFAWHEGTGEFHLIPSPFGSGTIAPYAINAQGVVVGTILVNQPGVTLLQGFHWHDGVLTRLEDLYDFDGRMHIPVDIDDEGTIVGYLPAGDGGTAEARPFLIKEGILLEFDPFPGGWRGTEAKRHNAGGGFVAQTWNHRDLPSHHSLAVYGDGNGYIGIFERPKVYSRTTPNSVNVHGDGVGVGKRTDGGNDDVVVFRQGIVHRMRDLLVPGSPPFFSGNARGIAQSGDVTGGPYHLVPAPPPLGDLSRNCRRDLADLPLLLEHWGEGETPADLNGDGRVDLEDLLILLRLIAHDLSF